MRLRRYFPTPFGLPRENDGPLARLPKADRFLLPLPAFAGSAEVGIANVTTGQTGTPLSVPMLFRTRDTIELSFPLRVASIAIGRKLTIEPDRLLFGDRPIATASDYSLPVSYYGPRQTIRTVSAANLIDGQVDKEAIQGRIVVLGATATGAGDFFPTPFDSLMPGVEIISTAITHLIAGDGVVRDRPVRIRQAVTTIRASGAARRLARLAAKRDRSLDGQRGGAGMVGCERDRFRARHMARRRDDHCRRRTAGHPVRHVADYGRAGAAPSISPRKTGCSNNSRTPGLQQWLTRDPDFLLAPVRQNAAVVFVDLSGFASLSETRP